MNFEGQSGSASQEICDLTSSGPDDVSDEPPFGSLQFIVLEVLNALLNLGPDPPIVLRLLHCHFVCSSSGHRRLVFFLIGGSSRLLPLFLRVGSAMMCRTIALLIYRHMYEDLKGQLADCQHGFVKGRSTVPNLLE
jgi:hypothetical protein